MITGCPALNDLRRLQHHASGNNMRHSAGNMLHGSTQLSAFAPADMLQRTGSITLL